MAIAKADKKRRYFVTVTKDKIDAILEDIRAGSPVRYAAQSNCISYSHFKHLVAQGIVDQEHGLQTLESSLAASLATIFKNRIIKCQAKIENNKKGHKGAEWILEHAFWREFGSHAEAKQLAEEIDEMRQLHARDNADKKYRAYEQAINSV